MCAGGRVHIIILYIIYIACRRDDLAAVISLTIKSNWYSIAAAKGLKMNNEMKSRATLKEAISTGVRRPFFSR